jgi:hypothetical protein
LPTKPKAPTGGLFHYQHKPGDAMPFNPNFPFDPADPSQWWQALNLLRTLA